MGIGAPTINIAGFSQSLNVAAFLPGGFSNAVSPAQYLASDEGGGFWSVPETDQYGLPVSTAEPYPSLEFDRAIWSQYDVTQGYGDGWTWDQNYYGIDWASDTVSPNGFGIDFQFNAFIPQSKGFPIANSPFGSIGENFGLEPQLIDFTFAGNLGEPQRVNYFNTNNREFAGQPGSSKLSLYTTNPINSLDIGRLDPSSHYFTAETGMSRRLRATIGMNPQYAPGDYFAEDQAKVEFFTDRLTNTPPNTTRFIIGASAGYPFVASPKIDYGMMMFMNRAKSGSVHVVGAGTHNRFPAYEILINNSVVYSYYPSDPGPGVNLLTWKNFEIDVHIDSHGRVIEPKP